MRRLLAAVALVALVAGAGCAAFGPGPVDRERLNASVSYDDLWSSPADVTISIERERYRVVYRVENRSTLEVYRFHRLNNRRPIDPIGLAFRHPNGTVVGADAIPVEKTRSHTTITPPAEFGQVAMGVPKTGKRVRVPAILEGSYEVILPPNARVRLFLLGRASPGNYSRSVDEEGRVHLRWDEVRGDRVVVRYYLVRDMWLFGGLVGASSLLLAVGSVYLFLQLRDIQARREEVAWEGGDDPP